MSWGVFMLVSTLLSIASTIVSNRINKSRQQQALEQQKELMREQAPLAMEGYESAGINPWAAGTSPISSSTPSAPSMPFMGEAGLQMLPQLLQSMTSSGLNVARTDETYVKSELGKANIELVKSKVGLTEAEAVVAVQKSHEIQENINFLISQAKYFEVKTKTEGYIQDNYQASTNLLGEQSLTEREKREKIILEGKVTAYNLDFVLPSVARKAFNDANLSQEEVLYKKGQIAELFNNVTMQGMDVERALITYSMDMATHIYERESANSKAYQESAEGRMRSDVWSVIEKDPRARAYLEGLQYLEIMFGPMSRTLGTALGGQGGAGAAGLTKFGKMFLK